MLDPDSGFYYNRARWMDPGVGRFTARDIFPGRPTTPVSQHRYLYANNAPSDMTDPTGKFSFSLGQTLSALALAAYFIASDVVNLAGLFRNFQNKRPIAVRSQLFVVADSGWSEEEAEAAVASASSLWASLAGISVIPTSIRSIPADERLREVTFTRWRPGVNAIEEFAPNERQVTVFVHSTGIDFNAGVSTPGGRLTETDRAYSFVSGAFWVPRSLAVAHEWGHAFNLRDSWIASNLMNSLPYGPALTPSQIDQARAYAKTY